MSTGFEDFLGKLPPSSREKKTRKTLETWHRIYTYIEIFGNADTVDNDDFLRYVDKLRFVSTAVVRRHLRDLQKAGVIVGHILVKKPDKSMSMLTTISPLYWGRPPTKFIRYTMPGCKPSLRLQQVDFAKAKFKRGFEESEMKDSITSLINDLQKVRQADQE